MKTDSPTPSLPTVNAASLALLRPMVKTTLKEMEMEIEKVFQDQYMEMDSREDGTFWGNIDRKLMSLADLRGESYGRKIRHTLPEDFQKRLQETMKQKFEELHASMVEKASEILEAGVPKANLHLLRSQVRFSLQPPSQKPGSKASIPQYLYNRKFDYKGESRRKGIFELFSDSRKPFMLIMMMGSMFGISMRPSSGGSATDPVTWILYLAILSVFLVWGIVGAIHNNRIENEDIADRELDRSRQLVKNEIRSRLSEYMGWLKRTVMKEVKQNNTRQLLLLEQHLEPNTQPV